MPDQPVSADTRCRWPLPHREKHNAETPAWCSCICALPAAHKGKHRCERQVSDASRTVEELHAQSQCPGCGMPDCTAPSDASGCPPHEFDILRQCKKCGLGSVGPVDGPVVWS